MTLDPSLDTVQAIKDSIFATLQNHALPVSARAAIIAPQLAIVNQWSDQIPLVLEHPDAPTPVNLVFAIRKDLYTAPQFVYCVLGIPALELPPAFPAFLSMILKLIGAQKSDKDKPLVKVSFPYDLLSFAFQLILSYFFCLVQPKRILRTKSKTYVDSDDDIEITLPAVSDVPIPNSGTSNDTVSFSPTSPDCS